MMPDRFWLISYGPLVWDRTLLAFVPQSSIGKRTQKEIVERFWFLSLEEAETQRDELASLGVDVKIFPYSLTKGGKP